MKLIDKDAVLAEIDRRIQFFIEVSGNRNSDNVLTLLALKSFIDTLEVKEVDFDARKIIPEDVKVETVYDNCDVCPHKGNLMCCHNCPNF